MNRISKCTVKTYNFEIYYLNITKLINSYTIHLTLTHFKLKTGVELITEVLRDRRYERKVIIA